MTTTPDAIGAEEAFAFWSRLKTALHRADAPLPDDVRRWLLDAALQYDGDEALDKLLGLRGPGRRKYGTTKARMQRDMNLWIAWWEHSHGGDPCCPKTRRNRIFLEGVRRFERRLPRINQTGPLDAFERYLLNACRAHPLPSNDRYLLQIVDRERR